jgi:hypothetical protein
MHRRHGSGCLALSASFRALLLCSKAVLSHRFRYTGMFGQGPGWCGGAMPLAASMLYSSSSSYSVAVGFCGQQQQRLCTCKLGCAPAAWQLAAVWQCWGSSTISLVFPHGHSNQAVAMGVARMLFMHALYNVFCLQVAVVSCRSHNIAIHALQHSQGSWWWFGFSPSWGVVGQPALLLR